MNAFSSTKISSISLPKSLSTIDGNPFNSCGSLTTITVEANNLNYKAQDNILLNYDGNQLICYPGGKSETSFTVPSCITTLVRDSLSSSILKTIILPSSVTTISDYAFDGALEQITVNEENPVFYDVDGVLFQRKDNQNILFRYPPSKDTTFYAVPKTLLK